MKRKTIFLALLTGLIALSATAQHKQAKCVVSSEDVAKMLAAPYHTFDQEMKPGVSWRDLFMKGCLVEASDVIGRYIDAHHKQLQPDELRHLHFHRGQTLAFAGQNRNAIPHLKASLDRDAPNEWRAYVDATIAFLASDRGELERSRKKYAEIAGSASPRLRIIDNLIACFGKPYSEAAHCTQK